MAAGRGDRGDGGGGVEGGGMLSATGCAKFGFRPRKSFSVKLKPILRALLQSDRTQKICVQYKIILCCLVRSARLFVPVAFSAVSYV